MAAVELATAYISIVPSMKGVQGEVARQMGPVSKEADKQGKKAGGRFSKAFGGGAGKIAGVLGGAFAGAKVVDFMKGAVTAASDLSETVSKSDIIFGKNAKVIDKWASGAAKSMGLSKQQALESAASFGDMFSQIGFSAKSATAMSKGVVELSADLGSFNNLPTADVSERISAAFRGEYDSLQLLIPNINAARVEKEALAATGKKSAKELTAQEKAAATLAIVQKDGARAQGDFARTSDGLANSQKILGAQFEDLKARIGTALAPVMERAVKIGQRLTEWVQANPGPVKVLAAAFGVLAVAFIALTSPITLVLGALAAVAVGLTYLYTKNKTFAKVVDQVWKFVGKVVSLYWNYYLKPAMRAWWFVLSRVVIPAVRAVGRWVVDIWKTKIRPAWDAMKAGVSALGDRISGAKDRIVAGFDRIRAGVARVKDAFSTARSAIGHAWGKIGDAIRKPIGIAARALNTFISGLDSLMGKVSGGKLGIDFRIQGDVLGWKDGGYTGNKPANAIAGVVHGDEHVIRSPARRALEAMRPGALDYMNKTGRWPGYKSGGRVVWPAKGTSSRHSGYPWATWAGDINQPGTADFGAPVRAYRDGKVAATNRWGHSYGNHIRINHPGSGSTLYAHLSQIAVRAGQAVTAGQQIGRVGNTGNSFGPHLHFEIMGGAAKIGGDSGGGGGGLMGMVTSALDKFNAVGKFNKLVGKLKGSLDVAEGSPIGQMMKKIPSRLRDGAWDWVKDKLSPFDTGGLAMGKGLMFKDTQRPERVLSPRQTQAFESAMAGGFGAGQPKAVQLTRARIGVDELGAWIEGIAQVVYEDNSAGGW